MNDVNEKRTGTSSVGRVQRFLFGSGGLDLSGRMLHSPNRWSLGRVILVFVLSGFLPGLLVGFWEARTQAPISVTFAVLLQPVLILLAMYTVSPKRRGNNYPFAVKLLPADYSLRDFLTTAVKWGIILRLLALVICLLQRLVGIDISTTNNPLQLAEGPLSPFEQAVVVAAAVLLVPVAEEIFYRGIFYHTLGKYFHLPAAAVISTAVWALLHGSLTLTPPIFATGICLIFLYESTKTLWAPIAAHVGFNLTSFLTLGLFPEIFS